MTLLLLRGTQEGKKKKMEGDNKRDAVEVPSIGHIFSDRAESLQDLMRFSALSSNLS